MIKIRDRIINPLAKVRRKMNKFTIGLLALTFALNACVPTSTEPQPAPQPIESQPASQESTTVPVTSEPGQPAAAPAHIVIAMRPYMSFAPIYIAIEEGYFAEEGIDIEVIDVANAAEGMVGLATRKIDVSAGLIDSGLFSLIGQNPGIKIVADKGYINGEAACTYIGFLVRADTPEYSPGMDMSFLDGKKMIGWNNSVTEYALDLALATSGYSITDFSMDNLPAQTRAEALASGQYSLAGMGEPWIARGLKSGELKLWASLNQLIPDAQQAAIWYGPSLTENDPELGIRFMRAYKRGVEQYNLGYTERNIELFAQFAKQDPAEIKDICLQDIRSDLTVNTQSLIEFQEWAVKVGLLDEVYPIEKFYDGRFIEAVNTP